MYIYTHTNTHTHIVEGGIYLSIYLSVYLSIYLSAYIYTHIEWKTEYTCICIERQIYSAVPGGRRTGGMYALYVCHICMSYMYALYVCHICMSYMYAAVPGRRRAGGNPPPRACSPWAWGCWEQVCNICPPRECNYLGETWIACKTAPASRNWPALAV